MTGSFLSCSGRSPCLLHHHCVFRARCISVSTDQRRLRVSLSPSLGECGGEKYQSLVLFTSMSAGDTHTLFPWRHVPSAPRSHRRMTPMRRNATLREQAIARTFVAAGSMATILTMPCGASGARRTQQQLLSSSSGAVHLGEGALRSTARAVSSASILGRTVAIARIIH